MNKQRLEASRDMALIECDDSGESIANALIYVGDCIRAAMEHERGEGKEKPRRAAVSLVERNGIGRDGLVLCVWNKRYNGWSLPGGMVEPGESSEDAQARELREETGCGTVSRKLIFSGPHKTPNPDTSRASVVDVFRVDIGSDEPRQVEDECPVEWMTRTDFLSASPFASFYRDVFASNPPPSPAPSDGWTTLGELKPGDVFETKGGRVGKILMCPNPVEGYVLVGGVPEGTLEIHNTLTVRRLHVLSLDDPGLVEAVAREIQGDYTSAGYDARERSARRVLAVLKERR